MPDFMDLVQEHQRDALNRQIHAARVKPSGTAALVCEDCGEEIIAVRRAAYPSATRCVYCQSALELKAKHYRGQA